MSYHKVGEIAEGKGQLLPIAAMNPWVSLTPYLRISYCVTTIVSVPAEVNHDIRD